MDKIYIVMNYVEHDLKSLMETMKQPFLPGKMESKKYHGDEKLISKKPMIYVALPHSSCVNVTSF